MTRCKPGYWTHVVEPYSDWGLWMTSPKKASIVFPLVAALWGALCLCAPAHGALLGASVSLPAPAIPPPPNTPSLPAPRVPSTPTTDVSTTTAPVPSVEVSTSAPAPVSVGAAPPVPVAQALPSSGPTREARTAAAPAAAGSTPGFLSHAPGPYAARSGPPGNGSAGGTGAAAALNRELGQLGSSATARGAALRLSELTSALATALRGFGIGVAAPGAAGSARPASALPPRPQAGGARSSSGSRDLLGLKLPPEAGQAIMVAVIALASMLLLGVLFSDELGRLFSRLIHRSPG